MTDKTMTPEEVVARLHSGMTLGIGGWGSRRKPMALVRALLRAPVTDLTVISYGGPDVGLLAAAGRIRKLVAPFATLDSIPLEPHFRAARERGAFALTEIDEAMFMWGLHAAANRLPFLPVRAGIGSDVMRVNPALRTVTSPYDDGETFCRSLPDLCGVVGVPSAVFYDDKVEGRPLVRFAFCKRPEVLDEAVRRLGRLAR